jgi:cell division protein FtsB
MKILNSILVILLVLLTTRLISGHNGINFYNGNRAEVTQLKTANDDLMKRNELIAADVKDLKLGLEGIEERARNELGMIRDNETFFRLIPSNNDNNE